MRTRTAECRCCGRRPGAAADDDRLIGVQLDLMDAASIAAAAKSIEEAVGAPYALVHNAGISAAGMVEEADIDLWQRMFATHVMGPVALTKALLPSMRAAGSGRIVLVSSAGGVRGHARHRAVFRSQRRAGTVGRVAGGRDRAVRDRRDDPGHRHLRHRHHHRRGHHRRSDLRRALRPHAQHHEHPRSIRDAAFARPPDRFADGLLKALEDDGAVPPARRWGRTRRCLLVVNRFLPAAGDASHVAAGDGHSQAGRDAGWRLPVDHAQRAMVPPPR